MARRRDPEMGGIAWVGSGGRVRDLEIVLKRKLAFQLDGGHRGFGAEWQIESTVESFD